MHELRLGLVCYGGVSLAIYMHGVTRELQSLVNASHAYAADPDGTNPFARSPGTEGVYWEALKESQRTRGHGELRTRVVIDVIAGTSAGGINGVVLAKALAIGATQKYLRDVWIEKGDIARLTGAPWMRLVPVPLKAAAVGVLTAVKRQPALSGSFMLEQIFAALREMKPESEPSARAMRWPVELHVTLTDFLGRSVWAPAWDPKSVADVRHRHQLEFRSNEGAFDPDNDAALAFAARATSSFPGAFPAVQIDDVDALLDGGAGKEGLLENHWRSYVLSKQDAARTWFVDGGVLDNAPFELAMEAIWKRPADVHVERRLIYIEPDPRGAQPPPSGSAPNLVRTVWGALSTIPRHEPILNDLLTIRRHNAEVDEVRAIIREVEDDVRRAVPRDPPAPDDLPGYTDDAHDAPQQAARLAYARLKHDIVVERAAQIACGIVDFPVSSDHAVFVHDVIRRWAEDRKLFADTEEGRAFLEAFDTPYRERRLRFVIGRINSLYSGSVSPPRAQLNTLKRQLYEYVQRLTELEAAAREHVAGGVIGVFRDDVVHDWLRRSGDRRSVAKSFVDDNGDDLDRLSAEVQAYLRGPLDGFSQRAYRTIWDATEPWPDDIRNELRARYADFPIWDALLLPVTTFSSINELAEVDVLRISPLDANLLSTAGVGKLQGTSTYDFGAFFKRSRRENDYLWGRLDAVERLIWLLIGESPSNTYKRGFKAVLRQERWALRRVWRLQIRLLRKLNDMHGPQVSRRPDETPVSPA